LRASEALVPLGFGASAPGLPTLKPRMLKPKLKPKPEPKPKPRPNPNPDPQA